MLLFMAVTRSGVGSLWLLCRFPHRRSPHKQGRLLPLLPKVSYGDGAKLQEPPTLIFIR